MVTDQDLMRELRTEAIDTVEDRLTNLGDVLTSFVSGRILEDECLATIKLEVHSLKSVASSFDMKALKVLCHRFEDYLFILSDISERCIKDIHDYADRMSECLEAFVNDREIDISAMMRQLPAKGGFDETEVTFHDVEVMLVMEPGIATKIVTRELLECGYRMINVASTLDAVQLIPSMRPDMVIVSRVMPELNGIDLCCALKAMPSTRSIPVALIASVGKESSDLSDLPSDVPVLRKGSKFGDDVADVFVNLGIL